MQKKIRSSRSRSKYRDLFWFAIFCCLAGAVLNSFLFYKSFFRALIKLNEEPIATITFKYKVAQRKFIDRVVWDRLRQNSPVYNGDTIHTQNLSEAKIWFTDGNVMELDENTMAQVFLSETEGAGARLTQGTCIVDSSDSENSFTISSYGIQAVVSSGSTLNAVASSDEGSGDGNGETFVNFGVVNGNALVTTREGSANVTGGESLFVNEEGKEQAQPVLFVSSPSPNSKILNFKDGKSKVHFGWKTKNIPDESNVVLVITSDRENKNVIYRETVTNVNETDVNLSEGTYYWALKTETAGFFGEQTKEAVAQGRFAVINSASPELVTPVSGYEYTYRRRKPGVRFIWRESKYATTYRLTVAKDSEMKNVVLEQRSGTTSSIISSLGEGTYYWQITPFFAVNKIGFANPSKVQSFIIEKKGEMVAPALYLPSANGIIDSDEEGKGVNFSWKAEPEAVSYNLRVADNPELKNPKINVNTSNNYYSFSGKNLCAKGLENGKFYWSVSQTDDEGNVSAFSQARPLFSMKGQPNQHTIEPLDGYMVAESLVREMPFTWKRNLPDAFVTSVQFARDENFTSLVNSQDVTNTKLKGQNFKQGEYFWRLVSVNKIDNTVLETPPKMFKVVGNLDKPELTAPLGRAVARETVPYTFKWEAVEGADFYKFNIFKASTDALVYSDNVYGTQISLDLYSEKWLDKGRYYYQVQAQALAVPGVQSRRNGDLAKNVFQIIKLKPVEIVSPASGTKIPAVDAILTPPVLEWRSVEKCRTAQIQVKRKGDKEPCFVYPSDEQMEKGLKVAPYTKQINPEGDYGLRSGDYEIVVKAETSDGVDISNTDSKHIGRFTVLPMAPLDPATGLTVKPEVFNREYIIASKSNAITFTWNKVKNATDYYFRIVEGRHLIIEQRIKGTSYILDFNKLDPKYKNELKRGTFTWTVEAVRRIDTDKDGQLDKVLQEGTKASAKVKTDIPTPKASKAQGAKNPYGK